MSRLNNTKITIELFSYSEYLNQTGRTDCTESISRYMHFRDELENHLFDKAWLTSLRLDELDQSTA